MTKNTDEMGKKEITISFDMFEQWESLTDEEAGMLVKEIGSYVCYGTETTTPATKAMFATYKKQIDEARQKSEAKSELLRAAGRKGAQARLSLPQARLSQEENEEENEKERSKGKDKEEDKEEEKKTQSVKEKTRGKCFVPPTLEEVRAHIVEKGYTHVNADTFWNFYESKGWTVGKERMKSWHGAVAYIFTAPYAWKIGKIFVSLHYQIYMTQGGYLL